MGICDQYEYHHGQQRDMKGKPVLLEYKYINLYWRWSGHIDGYVVKGKKRSYYSSSYCINYIKLFNMCLCCIKLYHTIL